MGGRLEFPRDAHEVGGVLEDGLDDSGVMEFVVVDSGNRKAFGRARLVIGDA